VRTNLGGVAGGPSSRSGARDTGMSVATVTVSSTGILGLDDENISR